MESLITLLLTLIMVLAILNNGMTLLNVVSHWQSIVIGMMRLFAISVAPSMAVL